MDDLIKVKEFFLDFDSYVVDEILLCLLYKIDGSVVFLTFRHSVIILDMGLFIPNMFASVISLANTYFFRFPGKRYSDCPSSN